MVSYEGLYVIQDIVNLINKYTPKALYDRVIEEINNSKVSLNLHNTNKLTKIINKEKVRDIQYILNKLGKVNLEDLGSPIIYFMPKICDKFSIIKYLFTDGRTLYSVVDGEPINFYLKFHKYPFALINDSKLY